MKLTTNLKLKKPDLTDYVNVEDFNENADVLDAEVKALKDGSVAIGSLTTTSKTLQGAINELKAKDDSLSTQMAEITSQKINMITAKAITDVPSLYPIGYSMFRDWDTWGQAMIGTHSLSSIVETTKSVNTTIQRVTLINTTPEVTGIYQRGAYSTGDFGAWEKVATDTDMADKMNKPTTAVAGRVATFNANKDIVDSGYTIAKSVPSSAVFIDTVYTHPSTHPASMIIESTTKKFVSDEEKSKWNGINSVPKGLISMWSGTIAGIPSGWGLCDGASGTPDLRHRFVMGAISQEDMGLKGGENTVALTVEQIPSHTHSGSTAVAGVHSHSVALRDVGTDVVGGADRTTNHCGFAGAMSSAGSHTHGIILQSTGGGTAHENKPAYYKLAFIMKL